MKLRYPIVLAACAVALAGCGGANTFSKDFGGPGGGGGTSGDFRITIYNGTSPTVGDGTSLVPNGPTNRALLDSPMTIIVRPIHGFRGTIHLSPGTPTNGFALTPITPTDLALNGAAFAAADFGTSDTATTSNQGQVSITATSGGITHTTTAYFGLSAAAKVKL